MKLHVHLVHTVHKVHTAPGQQSFKATISSFKTANPFWKLTQNPCKTALQVKI